MKYSAGLLPYRRTAGVVEVFLVHMAGPYWAHKNDGAWSIAKGEYDPLTQDAWEVAQQEFFEEVGMPAPAGERTDLGEYRMPSGKRVRVFALRTAATLRFITSNPFEMEWPPGSGRMQQFPETDDAAWFGLDEAAVKIVRGQREIMSALADNGALA